MITKEMFDSLTKDSGLLMTLVYFQCSFKILSALTFSNSLYLVILTEFYLDINCYGNVTVTSGSSRQAGWALQFSASRAHEPHLMLSSSSSNESASRPLQQFQSKEQNPGSRNFKARTVTSSLRKSPRKTLPRVRKVRHQSKTCQPHFITKK